MASKHWKNIEKYVAERFGGTRPGATGTDTADVINDEFCIQVKYRKSLPEWLHHALHNAAINAARHTLLPLVILKERGTSWDEAIAMMPLKEWEWMRKQLLEKKSSETSGEA